MQIRVDNLQGRPRILEFSEPVDSFPALVAMSEEGEVVFRGDVSGSLSASYAGDVVRVEGHASVDAVFACSRCLARVERRLDVPLVFCYQELELHHGAGDPEDVELTLRDLELIPFQGDEVNPDPEIAQELIMAVPQSVLCRENCAGLCPVCGIDRNRNVCQCEAPVFHDGLARLKNFKTDRD